MRLRAAWLLPIAGALLFLGPMLLTDRGFSYDWVNHLWLVYQQQLSFDALGHPSHYIEADKLGFMYPEFAFYGGSLYAVLGTVAALIGGHTTTVYVGAWAIAFAASWAGWSWLAKQAGLRGWQMHVPALVFSFATFRITVAYAGGAFSEFFAPSFLPLVAAAALHLLRAPRIGVAPAAVLVAATAALTGSHNITLVWGSVTLLVLGAVALVAFGRPPLRRALAVLGLAALAASLNGWFLVPDIVNAGTVEAKTHGYDRYEEYAEELNHADVIFSPLPRDPIPNDGVQRLYVQVPLLALLWALVCAWLWRGSAALRRWRVLLTGALAWLTWLLVLVLTDGTALWEQMPGPFSYVQFPHRLHTYTSLLIAATVLITLVGVDRSFVGLRRRVALGSLAAVAVFMVAVGTWQVWAAESVNLRDSAFTARNTVPAGWYDGGIYRTAVGELFDQVPQARRIHVPLDGDPNGFRGDLDVPDGPEPILTNIGAGPELVDVDGLRIVGRDPSGYAVVVREAGAPQTGPVAVELKPAASTARTVGFVLTALAAIALAGIGLASRRS